MPSKWVSSLDYLHRKPASAGTIAPVIPLTLDEARKETTSATSSTFVTRPKRLMNQIDSNHDSRVRRGSFEISDDLFTLRVSDEAE